MIQRVQTVYLSLGALLLAAFLVTPAARQFEMGALGTAGLYFSGLLAAGAAAASIFLFARRQLQRKVIVIGQLGTVALLAILVGGLYAGGALRTQEGIDGILLFGVALPVVAYIALFLARRAIGRDIRLVDSVNRLR